MATVRAFKAIRPAKKYAPAVASLPYDVMNRQEAAAMAEDNPNSFLRISRAEINLPEIDAYSDEVYEKANSELNRFLDEGILFQDSKPMFYVYRQIMNGRPQTGIVACVSVDEYNDNTIKKHEYTRMEKEIDRINHFKFCRANTEPIFLTYRADEEIDRIVEKVIASDAPEYDFLTSDGISNILWKIENDSLIAKLGELFDGVENLYIADGHHRSASAAKVGEYFRNGGNYSGEEEFNFFMAVIIPSRDLRVFDYNRVVKDLNGLSVDDFIARIKEAGFDVNGCESGKFAFSEKHVFGMFLDEKWYELKAKSEIVPEDLIDSLDVSVLQNNLLSPILGIADPRTDKRIDFVGGIRGFEGLEKRVYEDMAVAFAVPPVEMDDLLAVADAGEVMPPKSTWFEPKLASGLFVHSLKD